MKKQNEYKVVRTERDGFLGSVVYLCPKHGEFSTSAFFKSNGEFVARDIECPACRREWYEEHAEELAAEEERHKIEEENERRAARERWIEQLVNSSGIPTDYRNVDLASVTFSDPGNAETLRQVRLYAERFEEVKGKGVGLFLYGETGTGKTHLACALLRALMPEVPGKYVMTWELIRAIKNAKFGEDPLKPYMNAPLLVIDEIGVQYGSKFEETSLYPLIDSRVTERRPTIFISNVQPDTKDEERREQTVRGMLGERLWDRVQYRSIFLPLHGASVRKRYRSVDELLEGGE
jgi:DNA replication protein DnaC